MADFINTIDVLGDDAVIDSIINRTITEFKDDKIEEIGISSFYKCTNLVKVDTPKVKRVEGSAFGGCTNLEEVNIPMAEWLGNWLLSDTAVKRLSLPRAKLLKSNALAKMRSLVYIELHDVIECFHGFCSENPNLTALVIRNVDAVPKTWNVFADNTPIANGTGYIYVPKALVESYKVATNWSTYASQIRALEDYTVDGTVTGELDETKI